MTDIKAQALKVHNDLKGKIEVKSKAEIKTLDDLSIYYTPGVGAVSSFLAQNKHETKNYTIKSNTIAVVSDGSAVLGLGNIGPEAAIPVMEGKAMLFKQFGGVNAFPIVLDTQETDEIIHVVKNIAPVFGGINLEDISAPRCFEIEQKLRQILDIPAFHDDQHGTSIVVLAGLINAFKVIGRDIKEGKVVIIGAGAAGNATAKILVNYGVKNTIVLDSKGIINKERVDLDKFKGELSGLTNPEGLGGGLEAALEGADAVIGVSKAGILKIEHLKLMKNDRIVFAMANPEPEIMPDQARQAGVKVLATGRSDFPNQVNNSLVFPGIFKGALEGNVKQITTDMELKAAQNLAGLIEDPKAELVIPSIFDPRVVEAVSSAVKEV